MPVSDAVEIAVPTTETSRPPVQELWATLDRANQGRSIFRGVAHDLSNASQAFTTGMAGDLHGEIDLEKWSLVIRWMELKLNRSIAILRDFATGLTEEEGPVLVHEVLDSAHGWQVLQRSQAETPVRLDVDRDLAAVRASGSRLRQIVLALIANAKEALGGQAENEIRLAAVPSTNGVTVVVEDSGPGIDFDIRDRVFDAFFTTKDSESHFGLGLTVAQLSVESWGGTIGIADRPEGGARVELFLPYWTIRRPVA